MKLVVKILQLTSLSGSCNCSKILWGPCVFRIQRCVQSLIKWNATRWFDGVVAWHELELRDGVEWSRRRTIRYRYIWSTFSCERLFNLTCPVIIFRWWSKGHFLNLDVRRTFSTTSWRTATNDDGRVVFVHSKHDRKTDESTIITCVGVFQVGVCV